MASGVNKVILIGNLGADPDLKYTSSGAAVCELRLATNESWIGKDGERHERTEWHRVIAWNKVAEICGQHLRKSRQIYVEGKIQTRQWEDKDGNKRYTTEVVAREVKFLGGREGGEGSGQPTSRSEERQGVDDDIPF